MTISLHSLADLVRPESTLLLFGAGASIPSGAPSVAVLKQQLGEAINVDPDGFAFAELCSLVEMKCDRARLVKVVRDSFRGVRPSGGILNVADYEWPAIFTTNYDDLVERVFIKAKKPISVLSSNFDFGVRHAPGSTPIYKIHGTIGLDVVDGHRSRLILTADDNDLCEDYREALYDRLKADLSSFDLLIVGQSLADPDLDAIVRRAVKLRQSSGVSRSIYLLSYTADESRALLYKSRGIRVAFGGIDDLFLELAKKAPSHSLVHEDSEELVPLGSHLNPITIDVEHQTTAVAADFGRMFAGGAPTYSDIRAGLTFDRVAQAAIVDQLCGDRQFEMIVGASGVGKTALARKVVSELQARGFSAWEHRTDREFFSEAWVEVAERMAAKGVSGVLLLDDAHLYLPDVNRLADSLAAKKLSGLKLVITSARNHWRPRVKSPELFRNGNVTELSQLDHTEVGGLLTFVERSGTVAKLVDKSFRGFTASEKRRRLVERCNRDFFVCLKNIFANDSFDTIVLREFAAISGNYQDIYKYICALEALGVVVHRQLVIRLLQIQAQDVAIVLGNLEGLVEEYEINRKESVFGWRGRHVVISEIIAKHKFSSEAEIHGLLKQVVARISPTYDVEIRTLRQLCSIQGGISRISAISDQNELLRMMISAAPRERVPRHRLISNLIRSGAFTDAETEIRVFENDLKLDGPVRRYKVRLLVERAISVVGLMPEDKAAMLNEAYGAAQRILNSDSLSKQSLQLFGDVSLELFKVTGDYTFVDIAMERMKAAEQELQDPEITRLIYRFDQRITPASQHEVEFDSIDLEPD